MSQIKQFFFAIVLLASLGLTSAYAEVFLREGVPPYNNKALIKLPDFQSLAKGISPAVVSISVESDFPAEDDFQNQMMEWDPSFNNKNFGSGVIVGDQGYIITNYHVIERAKSITVKLLGEDHTYEAKLIGTDDKTDLALIKIKSDRPLEAVYLGNSDDVEVGQWVLAIGNQFELGQSMTAGIVSGKSRHISEGAANVFEEYIQTDASINPGSSGGPLINTSGQVIGINSAIYSPGRQPFGGSGFNIGIGFSIPINICKQVISEIKQRGRVTRGLLGVVIQHLNADLAAALQLKDTNGALVTEVLRGTPAAEAGFLPKDVIVEYGDFKISNHDDLPRVVAKTTIGEKIKVTVIREGKFVRLKPLIVEMGADRILEDQEEGYSSSSVKIKKLGLTLQDLSYDFAQALNIDSGRGLFVVEVRPGSVAAEAGIIQGDVILEIDNHSLLDSQDLLRIVEDLSANQPVLILVRKKEGTRFLTLKVR